MCLYEFHDIILYLKFNFSDNLIDLIFSISLISQKLIQRSIILYELISHLPKVWMDLIDVNIGLLAVWASKWACLGSMADFW